MLMKQKSSIKEYCQIYFEKSKELLPRVNLRKIYLSPPRSWQNMMRIICQKRFMKVYAINKDINFFKITNCKLDD